MWFKRKNKEIELFDNPRVNELETSVANSLGVKIYSGNKDILRKLTKEEIELSKIKSDTLLSYFTNNYPELLAFTIRAYGNNTKIDDGEEYPKGEEIPDSEKPKTIETCGPAIGFGITHAIYFHFLYNDLTVQLSDYLKKRRIPFSNRLLTRLTKYYDETKTKHNNV